MQRIIAGLLLISAILVDLMATWQPAHGQTGQGLRPVDLMIVIDNSCSMFPREKIIPGCTSFGSDPEFLRIQGANLFIARLGFGEENEVDYQVGVVGLGDEPVLVSPLQPIEDTRDILAREIADPRAQSATQIVPALEMAYGELRQSPNRKPDNLPALVLITDGVPWPREGQSNTDIEDLIAENDDIPLFLMLLQGAEARSEEYAQYVRFWQQMQTRYSNVFVYVIGEAADIEDTYNTIIAQLQNTVPTKGITITPDVPLRVFVSEFVQKVVITIIHPSEGQKGQITIEDPLGQPVLDSDPGVAHFRGDENPVEVFSIAAPRLDDALKESFWAIRADQAVDVFIDREGSYRIHFINPPVSPTDVTNVYLALETQNAIREFALQFSLIKDDGSPVTKPQPIRGQVIFPDGTQETLVVSSFLVPDPDGVYVLLVDLANTFPGRQTTTGRFIFVLDAGSGDTLASGMVPIASARLLVDLEPKPFIQVVSPSRIFCRPGQSGQFAVTVGGYESAAEGSLEANLNGEQEHANLESSSPGVFSLDTTGLCTALINRLACSTQLEAIFELQVEAQRPDGSPFPPMVQQIPVAVEALACTPTPQPILPTWTPRPTPSPTPIPDSDQDGLLDPEDACPTIRGWRMLGGCPLPGIIFRMAAGLFLGALIFSIIFGGPWLMVRTFAKPPMAYVMACQRGKVILEPTDVHAVGMARRRGRVTIGGNPKKAHIHVPGLKPVEFAVVEDGEKVVLKDVKTRNVKETFGTLSVREVLTSNPQITLLISMNLNNLKNARCH